jgi:flagellar basal-body rod protein FlgF
MDRGSYDAASGGLVNLRLMDVVANNLANVNTAGFKKEFISTNVQEFSQTLAAKLKVIDPNLKNDHLRLPAAVNISTKTDFSQGPIKYTGNVLDVALTRPNDFLVVITPNGPRYTRSGNFNISSSGQLVNSDGFPVSGDGGAISITQPNAKISENGTLYAGNQQLGKIQVVRINNPENLERVGGNNFKPKNNLPITQSPVEPELAVQSIEMPNISITEAMVQMINAHRGFQMYTKIAQSIDSLNQEAISRVGRSQ